MNVIKMQHNRHNMIVVKRREMSEKMTKLNSVIAVLISTVVLVACAKKDNAQNTEVEASSAVVQDVSAEQQAAIDSIDQPILDDKNTDIPSEVSNAVADVATAEVNGSEAVAH